MRHIFISILAATALMTGCAPHKLDIHQGTVLTEEKLDSLRIGMDQQQVQFVMGSPLLLDPFHKERWDYYYSFKPGRDEREQYHATLWFDQAGRLERMERKGPIPPNADNLRALAKREERKSFFSWPWL